MLDNEPTATHPSHDRGPHRDEHVKVTGMRSGARNARRDNKPRGLEQTAEGPAPDPTIAAVVRSQTGCTWSRARTLCTEGRVIVDGHRNLDPASRVAAGSVVVVDEQAPRIRSSPLEPSAIVFADRDLVVVDKPAGILSFPDEPGARGTLADFTRALLRAMRWGPDLALATVHRLDRDTSGLMVFARNAEATRRLAAQFRAHDIDRVYVAIAHGEVAATRVETVIVPDRGDGIRGSFGLFRRGSGEPPASGKRAVTHVNPVTALAGATLIQCRLDTGRQHQIRIHLAELGHPLLGERVYIRDYAGRKLEAARTMLHAHTLGFAHPRTGERILFERPPPDDFLFMVEALRRR
jgi:23S rRNA pseudouridine1911/1915/1917 synthase